MISPVHLDETWKLDEAIKTPALGLDGHSLVLYRRIHPTNGFTLARFGTHVEALDCKLGG